MYPSFGQKNTKLYIFSVLNDELKIYCFVIFKDWEKWAHKLNPKSRYLPDLKNYCIIWLFYALASSKTIKIVILLMVNLIFIRNKFIKFFENNYIMKCWEIKLYIIR